MRDEEFGYVLHPVDLAMNKAMAAAGRREVRDLVDLVTVHETILPLGAVIWAAVEKAPGFTPEGLIAEIRRNINHPAAEWRALVSTEPLDPQLITSTCVPRLTRQKHSSLRCQPRNGVCFFYTTVQISRVIPEQKSGRCDGGRLSPW